TGENINLVRLPYELGILHYASDTPYTRGKNLGAGSLSYFGMDATYATSIAIVRRIFANEINAIAREMAEKAPETPDEQPREEPEVEAKA
ncbi:MAG: hypothetical protein J2P37_09385, partial [Ktedonobacteraceae bacterium]|nr:hypothetical protein [Ktedonobacteraceae bacterium]